MKKGAFDVGNQGFQALAAIILLIIILAVFAPQLLRSGDKGQEMFNPSCEQRDGTCSKERCASYIDENSDMGAFKCEEDEYCCKEVLKLP